MTNATAPKTNNIGTRLITDIMSRNLKVVSPDLSVGDARKQLKDNAIRHLLVVNPTNGALIGVLSDRDVRAILSPFVGTPQATEHDNATTRVKVGDIIKKPPFISHGNETVRSVVEIILQKKVGCIPVINDTGVPVGVVTTDDLLRTLLSML